jgi:hypothetical protein
MRFDMSASTLPKKLVRCTMSAVLVGLALSLSPASAQSVTTDCGRQWRAAKQAGATEWGRSWPLFLRGCRERLAATNAPPPNQGNASAEGPPIRIQVSVNLFFAGPTGDSEEAVKLRERARLSIYEMAAGECALIELALAKTCRLEAVNVNLNRQFGGQAEGYMAGGNFTLQATLK